MVQPIIGLPPRRRTRASTGSLMTNKERDDRVKSNTHPLRTPTPAPTAMEVRAIPQGPGWVGMGTKALTRGALSTDLGSPWLSPPALAGRPCWLCPAFGGGGGVGGSSRVAILPL